MVYQGTPQFKPIEGTKTVEQAVNTDKDIVKYGDLYYMCFQGVWFMSKAATGPWEVASTIPQADLHHSRELVVASRHLRDGRGRR